MNIAEIKERVTASIGKYKYLLLVVAAGIILILLPTSGKADEEEKRIGSDIFSSFSIEREEKRLEEILGEMENVGKVRVMLTVKESIETVYAEERSGSVRRKADAGEMSSYDQDQSSKPVLVSEGAGVQNALTAKYIYPCYQGITVVCEGGNLASVKYNVTESLSALIGVGADKITIVKMKN